MTTTTLPTRKYPRYGYLTISIIAIVAICLGDYVVPIRNMYGEVFANALNESVSDARILCAVLVMCFFPFAVPAFKPIFVGTRMKAVVPALWYFTAVVCVPMHVSFYYYHAAQKSVTDPEMRATMISHFDSFKDVMGTIYFIGFGLAALALFVQMLRGDSVFPRTFALLNPVVWVLVSIVIRLISPTAAKYAFFFCTPSLWLMILVITCLIYLHRREPITA